MSPAGEDLSSLLHAAVPDPPADVEFGAVAAAVVRRRRRRQVAGVMVAVAGLTAGSAAVPWLIASERGGRAQVVASQPVTASQPAKPIPPDCRPVQLPTQSVPGGTYELVAKKDVPGGYYALLLGTSGTTFCIRDPRLPTGGTTGTSSPRIGETEWLLGPLNVDYHGALKGGVEPVHGKVTRPPRQLLQVVAGRVGDQVARVTFTGADGVVVSEAPVDGAFILSVYLANASDEALKKHLNGGGVEGAVLRAYDAEGRVLAEVDPGWPPKCYLTPDGTRAHYGGKPPPEELASCKPALRWRR
jgi:hypothetical protein